MWKSFLKEVAEFLLPPKWHLCLRFYWLKLNGKLDPEMYFVSEKLKSKERFLDVGSNVGIYSYFFLKKFKKIEAFEPLNEITYRLKALNSAKLNINNVAISDQLGFLDFFIPIRNGLPVSALASLEQREEPYETRTVDVKTIDDYNFSNVDLIKIDVEGHEYQVIQGAQDTLSRCRPVLIVEIEQRHTTKPIDQVFRLIIQQGYEGFFMLNGDLVSLDKFSYENNQAAYLDNVPQKG